MLLARMSVFPPLTPAALDVFPRLVPVADVVSHTCAGQMYLTNRFHFAVRLYSDNAQMTSKRGENKEVRYEPQASSVTDVLTTF